MVDNTRINKNSTIGDLVATDDVGGIKHQRVKMEYGADGTAQDVSLLYPMPVTMTSEANTDAFSRLRISEPVGIFSNKNVSGPNTDNWQEETSGVGAAITYLANESSVQLGVGTVSGEYALRQSTRYIPYIPGKSQLILMTGVLGAGKTNVTRRIGLFDDMNGLFFELDGTSMGLVIRSATDGTATDTVFPQASWNVDTLDGNGPSGITLDVSKAQIFVMDFQWLGVGKIRYGFNFNGGTVYCHSTVAANSNDTVFMTTPTLPFRYEIRNTGTAASASTMKEICASAASEGGFNFIGFEYAAGNQIALRTSISERTPVMAIRLKDVFAGKQNRRTVRFSRTNTYVASANACLELAHLNAPSDSTATWTDAAVGESAVEYSTDIAAVTGNEEHVFHSWYQISGTGQGQSPPPSAVSISGILGQHNFISQNKDSNNSQMLVLYATPLSGSCDVGVIIEWTEFD